MRKRTLASVFGATGSALAALVTVCLGCFAPVAFASLGVFGSVFAAWAPIGAEMEPYRPYMLSASVLLLGYAHWSVYLRRHRVREGAACPIGSGRTVKLSLWAATLVTAVAFAAPYLIFRYLVV